MEPKALNYSIYKHKEWQQLTYSSNAQQKDWAEQPAMAASHIRQGEHRFGSAAHGRTHTAYPCHGRADSDGRAQESQEEASGQKDGWTA